jgi:hypothetical protein
MAVGSGSVRGTRTGAHLLVVLIAAFACKREEDGAGGPSAAGGSAAAAPAKGSSPDEALAIAREVGAGWFGEEKWEEAHAVLESVAKSPNATAQDLANLACVKLHRFPDDPAKATAQVAEAKALCQQAAAKDPACASAHYVLGLIAFDKELVPADALREFALAVKCAPDDVPARMRWSEALDETGDLKGAIEQLEFVKSRGIEYANAYYKPAVYRLSRLIRKRNQGDDKATAVALTKEHAQLGKDGVAEATLDDIHLGNLARVKSPPPVARPGEAPKSAPPVKFEPYGAARLAEAGAVASLAVADLDNDGCDDLVALGANGLWIALRDGAAADGFKTREVKDAKGRIAGTRVVALDVENEGGSSVLVLSDGGVRLLSPDAKELLRDESGQLPALSGVADVVGVDYDHEGHLDLLFATAGGVKLVRNDGVPKDPSTLARQGPVKFHDVTAETGMPAGAFEWVASEDFDADQDIDFIAGGEKTPPLILSNLRKGRFDVQTPKTTGLVETLHGKPLLVDLDHDGKVDVVEPGAPPAWQRNDGHGHFGPPQPLPDLAGILAKADGRSVALLDLDWNGEPDLVAAGADGTVRVHYGSLTASGAPEQSLGGKASSGGAPLFGDFDDDGAPDLVTPAAAGVEIRRGSVAGGHALTLLLKGIKDNRGAVGAVCEVRAGSHYERRLAQGRRQVFGLGPRESADVARISWPNGVVQNLVQPKSAADDKQCPSVLAEAAKPGAKTAGRVATVVAVPQKEGLIGSCPFLYSWDGSGYRFVSDVLGTTPLGLPMKEGMYVPPDHDELVRVTSDQLAAAGGEYRFQFTEELREVTYLDRAQLWVVDHPAGIEVQPEERFSFPPFPPQKIHTVRGALPIVKAVDQTGRDWTKELTSVDDVHAVPFEPLDSRYLGLVTAHFLDLTLPDAVKSAKKVRLLMTGWLYWTDASVNIAADHTGAFDFVPPIFSVPDGKGGWRECGPPVGFPAGKTKTMVIDVTSMLNRDDPRLRIFSTIRLYWDAIRVAVDDDDAPITVTKLEAKRADLWSRGFSAPVRDDVRDHPARFDFAHLEKEPRWNQHHGMLTRYGDVLPLLAQIDDEFALIGSGDAIDLRFDATTTPPKPGMARTYLLFLDGWAKDADPNTMYSQTVEPLPFHAMSGYPYGPDEHYPDDEAHDNYQRKWNTRAGRRLIGTLVVPAGAATPN